jgi:hypothetical protein
MREDDHMEARMMYTIEIDAHMHYLHPKGVSYVRIESRGENAALAMTDGTDLIVTRSQALDILAWLEKEMEA